MLILLCYFYRHFITGFQYMFNNSRYAQKHDSSIKLTNIFYVSRLWKPPQGGLWFQEAPSPTSSSSLIQDVGRSCCLGVKHIPGKICQQSEHGSALHRPPQRWFCLFSQLLGPGWNCSSVKLLTPLNSFNLNLVSCYYIFKNPVPRVCQPVLTHLSSGAFPSLFFRCSTRLGFCLFH